MIVTVKDVQKAVCLRFNLDGSVMHNRQFARCYVRPRQIAMYLAREMTDASLPELGRRFGNRDHTTVLHGVRRITALMQTKPKVAEYVAECREIVATSDRWKEVVRKALEAEAT